MSYIDDSHSCRCRCKQLFRKRAREKLFMTIAATAHAAVELYTAIERRLEEIVRNDPRLKELRDRRRREVARG